MLDNHDECYKHRICNRQFPCDFCKGWDDEKRSKVEKMIEKSKERKGHKSLCVGGLPSKNVNPSVEAVVHSEKNLNPSVVSVTKDSSEAVENVDAVQIDISAIIQDQVKRQLENMFKDKQITSNTSSSLAASAAEVQSTPLSPVNEAPRTGSVRPHFDKFKPFDDQVSIMESTQEDNVSVHARDDLSEAHEERQSEFGLTSAEIPFGAPDSSDPFQWNGFIQKMASVLNIDVESEETENERTSYISSRLKNDKEVKKSFPKLPIEGTLIDVVKSVEKEATSGHLKNRSVRGRDDKAFMVRKDDFNDFCTPPKLDDNIEEGLVAGHRKGNSNNNKSRVYIPPFHKELDNDFRRIDISARAMFRAISYGTMISAFLDEAECEDDRLVGRKALINCFRSMADLTGRIMANSVMTRRKLFLRNVDFISKATEQKLLNLPILGNQLFNGQYFDTLHTSAENLRDARETQNVYSSTSHHSHDKNSKNRDDRKRKAEGTSDSRNNTKYAKTQTTPGGNSNLNLYSGKKDNFRYEGNRQEKRDHFSRKQGGGSKGFSSQRK